ncbi:lamin tail domain-containing protein [Polaribacter sp.]|uniref:lamin tail domain-containing protein n=1 Tax=Polaribacter sp. TaxID=1920175 RepID=UPI004047F3AE
MNIRSFTLKSFFYLFSISILFSGCESEDIKPALSLNISNTELSEVTGSITITATLNSAALQNITIPLNFSGTAIKDTDYTASTNSIIINRGQTNGVVTITGITDGIVEGNETIDFVINTSTEVLILSGQNISINLLDADFDADSDGVTDANDACPNVPGDVANNGCPFVGFIINEVLYDPADGIAGDANGDGTRDPNQDEFIEFFNSSATSIDLSGYSISDASQVRHTFPSGTIVPSKGVIVVFGGGNPTGTFGGAIVQTASTGSINMTNSGDLVTVKTNTGATILTFDINGLSGNPNEAFTRFPDIYGNFERYSNIPEANGAIHTPGTKVNGISF